MNREEPVSLKEIINDIISCFSDEYRAELKLEDYTDEDINAIVENILDNNDFDFIIQNEIEDYFNRKGGK